MNAEQAPKPMRSLWRVKERHAQGSHFDAGEVVRFIGGADNDMFEHLDGHDHWYLGDNAIEPVPQDATEGA